MAEQDDVLCQGSRSTPMDDYGQTVGESSAVQALETFDILEMILLDIDERIQESGPTSVKTQHATKRSRDARASSLT